MLVAGPEHKPSNIRAKVFAPDGAESRRFDCRTMLCRNLAANTPIIDGLRRAGNCPSQCALSARNFDCLHECVHANHLTRCFISKSIKNLVDKLHKHVCNTSIDTAVHHSCSNQPRRIAYRSPTGHKDVFRDASCCGVELADAPQAHHRCVDSRRRIRLVRVIGPRPERAGRCWPATERRISKQGSPGTPRDPGATMKGEVGAGKLQRSL